MSRLEKNNCFDEHEKLVLIRGVQDVYELLVERNIHSEFSDAVADVATHFPGFFSTKPTSQHMVTWVANVKRMQPLEELGMNDRKSGRLGFFAKTFRGRSKENMYMWVKHNSKCLTHDVPWHVFNYVASTAVRKKYWVENVEVFQPKSLRSKWEEFTMTKMETFSALSMLGVDGGKRLAPMRESTTIEDRLSYIFHLAEIFRRLRVQGDIRHTVLSVNVFDVLDDHIYSSVTGTSYMIPLPLPPPPPPHAPPHAPQQAPPPPPPPPQVSPPQQPTNHRIDSTSSNRSSGGGMLLVFFEDHDDADCDLRFMSISSWGMGEGVCT